MIRARESSFFSCRGYGVIQFSAQIERKKERKVNDLHRRLAVLTERSRADAAVCSRRVRSLMSSVERFFHLLRSTNYPQNGSTSSSSPRLASFVRLFRCG